MSAIHLRLKEASKRTVNLPPDTVSLLHAALNKTNLVNHDVNVHPDAVLEDSLGQEICPSVLLQFSARSLTPEAVTRAMAVLEEAATSDR